MDPTLQPPPPLPTSTVKHHSDERHSPDRDRRTHFNRNRTHSSGSVRGAFGPTKFDNANKHMDIYATQKKAMKSNFSRINKPVVHSHRKKSDIENGVSSDNRKAEVNLLNGTYGTNEIAAGNHGDEVWSPIATMQNYRGDSSDDSFEYSQNTSSAPPNHLDFRSIDTTNHTKNPKMLDLRRREMNEFSQNATSNQSVDSEEFLMVKRHTTDYGSAAHDDGFLSDHMSFASKETSLNDDRPFVQKWYESLVYNPEKPEFTSAQQTTWAVIIGIIMGIFTAVWSMVLSKSIEVVWNKLPKYLYNRGLFTDLDGHLPIPHFMWMCPTVFGGILSYVTASFIEKPIPGQNAWIESLHRIGIMDHSMFFHVVILSTLGMISGLSLGPEMPLILASSMIGSFIAIKTKQSVLSARVINLTASGAAIGGFFGFPMAGALFVLELPHRMGLQYFEALSPAVISSIISVIVNRIVTQNEVRGNFIYPFLEETFPSSVFYIAIVYGLLGTVVGIIYADGCLYLKSFVHDLFHAHTHNEYDDYDASVDIEESKSLLVSNHNTSNPNNFFEQFLPCLNGRLAIRHEPTRAGVSGAFVGAVVGIICMLLPHSMFWGEEQLQTLIDRGVTPLPIFEYDNKTSPISNMTAYAYCLVNQNGDTATFSTNCAVAIALTKIVTIGLSIGTGICGGHFWGPLYVGAAVSHVFVDVLTKLSPGNFLHDLSNYHCVAMLCIMGSAHIVTYRCHTAIILILTLTVTATNEESKSADYAALFPLLVVSCFVPLMLARNTFFYGQQRCRGDIIAVPEVLMEPLQEEIIDYEDSAYSDGSDNEYDLHSAGSSVSGYFSNDYDGVNRDKGEEHLSVSVHSHRSRQSVQSLSKTQTISRTASFELRPTLLGQARERANSSSRAPTPTGVPLHRRKDSSGSFASSFGARYP